MPTTPTSSAGSITEGDIVPAFEAYLQTFAIHLFSGAFRLSLMLSSLLSSIAPVFAADHWSRQQLEAAVSAVPAGTIDLSGKDLSGDDLTGFDLSGAKLANANLGGVNLHGVKLVGANLVGADLTNADMTFAWIMRADFTRARLHGAIMQTVVTSTGLENTADQAATFVEADLSEASITVHFSFDDMRRATFSNAHMTVVMANQSMGMLRTEFIAAKLNDADFTGAGLGHVSFRFAKLSGARFNRADCRNAEFDGADLTGADFTGANVQGATFESATLVGVKNLDLSNVSTKAK
jgi:uncharacterized protein YjbI with pentapeptide repeats